MPPKIKKPKLYTYTLLEMLPPRGNIHLWAVVTSKHTEPGGKLVLQLQDESASIPCHIPSQFAAKFDQLNCFDVIRIHRSQMHQMGLTTLVHLAAGIAGNHAVVWDGQSEEKQPKLATADNNTMTDQDYRRLAALRNFSATCSSDLPSSSAIPNSTRSSSANHGRPSSEAIDSLRNLMIINQLSGLPPPSLPPGVVIDNIKVTDHVTTTTVELGTNRADHLEKMAYYNYFAQVLAVYKAGTDYVIRVWDGTPNCISSPLFRLNPSEISSTECSSDDWVITATSKDSLDVLVYGIDSNPVVQQFTPGRIVLFANMVLRKRSMGQLAVTLHEANAGSTKYRCLAVVDDNNPKAVTITKRCNSILQKRNPSAPAPASRAPLIPIQDEKFVMPNPICRPLRISSTSTIDSIHTHNVQAHSTPLHKKHSMVNEPIPSARMSQLIDILDGDSCEMDLDLDLNATPTFVEPAAPDRDSSSQGQYARDQVADSIMNSTCDSSFDAFLDGGGLSRNDIAEPPAAKRRRSGEREEEEDDGAAAATPCCSRQQVQPVVEDVNGASSPDITAEVVDENPSRTTEASAADPLVLSSDSSDGEEIEEVFSNDPEGKECPAEDRLVETVDIDMEEGEEVREEEEDEVIELSPIETTDQPAVRSTSSHEVIDIDEDQVGEIATTSSAAAISDEQPEVQLSNALRKMLRRQKILSTISRRLVSPVGLAPSLSLGEELDIIRSLPTGSPVCMQNPLHPDLSTWHSSRFRGSAISWVIFCSKCRKEFDIERGGRGWCPNCLTERGVLDSVNFSFRVNVPCRPAVGGGPTVLLSISRDTLCSLMRSSLLTDEACSSAFTDNRDKYLSWKAFVLVRVVREISSRLLLPSIASVRSSPSDPIIRLAVHDCRILPSSSL